MGICIRAVLALIYTLQMLICSAVWLAQNLSVFDLQCMHLQLKIGERGPVTDCYWTIIYLKQRR